MSAILDAAYVVTILNGVSAIAVILGVAFVVLQLRQNSRLIEASNKQVEANFLQARSSILLSLVERLTDDSFAFKRKAVRDIVRKYQPVNWKGFWIVMMILRFVLLGVSMSILRSWLRGGLWSLRRCSRCWGIG